MTPATRRRLVGVLGMLASDQDGERAAAGLLATRLLASAGVTWDQVIAEEGSDQPNDPPANWCVDLALCQRNLSFLKTWGQGFVRNLGKLHTPSPKQQVTLNELADGLRARGRT